ncbi:hypothetical protein GUITHDRAFT_134382 [Guillardia theta CCMP2712]|uniref:Malic enzyme NAD-binding domain-containing protein n=1 Tax=Guillardia theta (strain CCMP2712) TaxID=905079 RepID=L1JSN0_GUITC|nr:hypothetical protein GUITHDRAFT_134382 [Guillardia theta CCMP2712]EKX51452.1 hypothetical protein GUITHDRAFT_134382 [Guillardia theta CCMP2712]|eukprot:XP_005838432.1 hypothetical protein GUITHDRAFT_134382 [Guillardia theta CCMP2712]
MAKYYHGHAMQTACEHYGEIPEKAEAIHFDMYHARQIEGVLASHVSRIREETSRGELQTIVVTDGEDTLDVGDVGTWSAGLGMSKAMMHAAMAGFHPKAILCVVLGDVSSSDDTSRGGDRLSVARALASSENFDTQRAHSHRLSEPWQQVSAVLPAEVGSIMQVIEEHSKSSPVFNDGLDGRATIVATRPSSCVTLIHLSVFTLESIGVPTPMAMKGLYTLEDRHHYKSKFRKPLPARLRGWLSRTTSLHELKSSSCLLGLHRNVSTVVEGIRATILIGASGIRGAFDRDVLRILHKNHERPGIIVLSNTQGKAECSSADTWHHTTGNGKTLYVGGDDPLPYRPLGYEGVALIPSRATSLFVYPGISLATFGEVTQAAGISSITPSMLQVAAETLARMASIDEISYGSLFPRLSLLKDISVRIAAEIIRVAQKEQKTNKVVPEGYKELLSFLQSLQDLDADDELVSSYSWQEGEKVEVKVGGEEGAFLAGAGGLTVDEVSMVAPGQPEDGGSRWSEYERAIPPDK